MARNSTIYKLHIELSDLRKNYFDTLKLVIALHPSETQERMLSRILCYCLHASPTLEFTRGLSSTDEPELWSKSLDDRIEYWIDLGQPDISRIKKACQKADQVAIYTYRSSASVWWKNISSQIKDFKNLDMIALNPEQISAASQLIERQIELSVLINDSSLEVFSQDKQYQIEFTTLTDS